MVSTVNECAPTDPSARDMKALAKVPEDRVRLAASDGAIQELGSRTVQGSRIALFIEVGT